MSRQGTGGQQRRAPRFRGARTGYTLLEMLAVLALLGILALFAAGSFRREVLGDLGAGADAHRLAADLIQARRRAIASGDNHLLVFQEQGGSISGYTVHRRLPSSTEAVDTFRPFADNLAVTVTPSDPEFDFEGAALAGGTITLAAPHRTWQVTVVQATGAVEVSQL